MKQGWISPRFVQCVLAYRYTMLVMAGLALLGVQAIGLAALAKWHLAAGLGVAPFVAGLLACALAPALAAIALTMSPSDELSAAARRALRQAQVPTHGGLLMHEAMLAVMVRRQSIPVRQRLVGWLIDCESDR